MIAAIAAPRPADRRGVVDAAPEIGGELRVALREACPLIALTAVIAVASRSARPGLAGMAISARKASGLPGGRPGRPVEDMIETRLAVRSGMIERDKLRDHAAHRGADDVSAATPSASMSPTASAAIASSG